MRLDDRVDEDIRPPVAVTAPATSKPPCAVSSFDSGIIRSERTNTAMPIGTLMKKIHGHESSSVSVPPTMRPKALPPIAIAAQTPSAFARSVPSAKVVEMIASAAGEMNAAPRPCSARPPISIPLGDGEAVEQRRDGEDDEAEEEEPLAAEEVAGAAAEQQEAAEHERVGVHDPLQVRLAEAEIVLDRRQRDVHDRRVEDDHELREADQDEDEPRIRCVSAHALPQENETAELDCRVRLRYQRRGVSTNGAQPPGPEWPPSPDEPVFRPPSSPSPEPISPEPVSLEPVSPDP